MVQTIKRKMKKQRPPPASNTFMQNWLGSISVRKAPSRLNHREGEQLNCVHNPSSYDIPSPLMDGSSKENEQHAKAKMTTQNSGRKGKRSDAAGWEASSNAHSSVKMALPVKRKHMKKQLTLTSIDLTETDDEIDTSSPVRKRREIVLLQQNPKLTEEEYRSTNSLRMNGSTTASLSTRSIACLPQRRPQSWPGASTESFVPPPPRRAVYDLQMFQEMWKQVEIDIGAPIEFFESQKGVRRANSKLEKTDTAAQDKAQYGRILCDATQDLFELHLKLDPGRDVYLDVGHGIGNTVLQAAYVCRCEARGIEVVEDRNAIAIALQSSLEDVRTNLHRERDGMDYQVGKVTFRRGSLEASENRAFLTQPPPGKVAIKAFCNNYNAVFSDRCAKAKEKYYLDDYLAGLFARMPPGSVLITLHPLNLVPGRSETQEQLEKHGLARGNKLNASFYELEIVELGAARTSVTWAQSSTKELILYKYTRLQQEAGIEEAVFLCCNPACERAHRGEAIHATKFVDMVYYSKEEPGVVMNTCGCNQAGTMSLRRRNKVVSYMMADDEL